MILIYGTSGFTGHDSIFYTRAAPTFPVVGVELARYWLPGWPSGRQDVKWRPLRSLLVLLIVFVRFHR